MNNTNNILKALGIIVEAEKRTASIKVEIGATIESGNVTYDALYITDCPARVYYELKKEGFNLFINNGKLSVEK
jgi:hypothetical protein